ncbi:hypothetical protein [Streptomyces sp. NPDC090445]|uniref:hypothetical protein n=1 Tax=Streptomyces sp. NPDC090445 TaxID=3365963 RepID=UPI0038133451
MEVTHRFGSQQRPWAPAGIEQLGAGAAADRQVDVASQMVPALPILFEQSGFRTLTGKNVLQDHGSPPRSP